MISERRRPPTKRRTTPTAQVGSVVTPPPGSIQASPSLMREGGRMICPGCEVEQDVLGFIPYDYSEKYADQVVAVHRCSLCGHVFALHPYPGGD